MLPYELTPAAEADLREIARYTRRQWGEQQAQRYASLLETCFQGIAQNSVLSHTFSERYPQIRVTRCEHHYIFYLSHEGMRLRIIAVLHENMDRVARIRGRLST